MVGVVIYVSSCMIGREGRRGERGEGGCGNKMAVVVGFGVLQSDFALS